MRKGPISVIVALSMVIALFFAAPEKKAFANNLLVNPSFETDSDNDGIPDGWSKVVTAGAPSISLDSSSASDGAQSVKMTGTQASDSGSIKYTYVLPGQSNLGYKVSAAHKTAGLVSLDKGAAIVIHFYNNSGQTRGTDTIVRGNKNDSDWTVLERMVTVPTGATKVDISLTLTNASGTVWWDNVRLLPVAQLGNGDFENDSNADGVPDQWSFSGGGSVSAETVHTYNWNRSLKVVNASSQSQSVLSQSFPLDPAYADGARFSVYYRTDNVEQTTAYTDGVLAKVSFLDAADTETGFPVYVKGNNGSNMWGRLDLKFKPPSGAAKLKIELIIRGAAGTVWWDLAQVMAERLEPDSVMKPKFSNWNGRPVISWMNQPNVAKYSLQVSADPTFASGVTTFEEILGITYRIPVDLPEGISYVRIKAIPPSGQATSYGPPLKIKTQRLEAYPDLITPNVTPGANDYSLLAFTPDTASVATVDILSGQTVVRTLTSGESMAADVRKTLKWDGKDDGGSYVANGTYTARLTLNVNGTNYVSLAPIQVNNNDLSGYIGLENNKDWSNFYKEQMELTAIHAMGQIDPATGRDVTIPTDNYTDGTHSSASAAFLLAHAYYEPGSSLYQSASALELAVKAMDFVLSREVSFTGSWTKERDLDENIDRFLAVDLIQAYDLLKNEPLIPQAKRDAWRNLIARAAQYQMNTYPLTASYGDYPNQDQNYVAVLGMAGVLLGNPSMIAEAKNVLQKQFNDVGVNGGALYIYGGNPVPLYQKHVSEWYLYYKYTRDPQYVVDLIASTKEYYPLAFSRNGQSEYATSGELKQAWLTSELPSGVDAVTAITGDGRNKMSGNVIKEFYIRPYWDGATSLSVTTFTAQTRDANINHIAPVTVPDYNVVKDEDIKGIRARWGTFDAALSNNKNSPTLATASLNKFDDKYLVRDSYLANVYMESNEGEIRNPRQFTWYYFMPPLDENSRGPAYQSDAVGKRVLAGDKLGVQYTKFIPVSGYTWKYTSDNTAANDWISRQTWITFKNRLIAMNSMSLRDTATTVNSGRSHFVRSRFMFGPMNGTLSTMLDSNKNDLYGSFNQMGFWIQKRGSANWEFNTNIQHSFEPGTIFARHGQGIAIQKKKGTGGNVAWGPYATDPDKRMSYNAVFFPLENHTSGKAWHDSASNNVSFGTASGNVCTAQIDADDGTKHVYFVASNQDAVTQATYMPVTLPNGKYTLNKYTDDTGVAASSTEIEVTNGSYSIFDQLNGESVHVYEFLFVSDIDITSKLYPIADAYVRSGAYAGANFGGDPRLVIKTSTGDGDRRSYLKFDLSSLLLPATPAGVTGSVYSPTVTGQVYRPHVTGDVYQPSVTGNVYLPNVTGSVYQNSVTDAVYSVKLGLYMGVIEGAPASTVTTNVYAVDNDAWTEYGINFNNKPPAGALLGSMNLNAVNAYREIDVTAYVLSQLASDKTASFVVINPKSLYTEGSSRQGANKPYLIIERR
ncbi:DNRLRE domain-containing protein [Paenibacillus ehimensis]|uniref:CBM96 family carbohydrate-binding protein n=1 Tax=Paenibacillus ehimensis TaxID=79264 RepID=UPI002DBD9B0B|nr:DNRLRE domain-containing protein [Paenibacillus ehimensis]MEC0207946.1 DNRLRE domain-containing protein [Paenibacillus ehimensis]